MCNPTTLDIKLARLISEAIVGQREGIAEALGHRNRGRLDHACRCDDGHHPIYAVEYFHIYELAGRPDGYFRLFEELYDLRVVDLTKLTGRDPSRKGLILALRSLTEVLERYDDARSPDSDGGAEITNSEWREIEKPLSEALGRLVAFRDARGETEGR